MKSLAILIINWNTRLLLEKCLKSIQEHNGDDFETEIVVVDNGSTDGSPQMVKSAFPAVTLIENQEHVGFATANNQAALLTNAEYLLLLNSDTIVETQAIQDMCAYLNKHREVGIVGCKLTYADGSEQISFADYPTFGSALLGRNQQKHVVLHDNTPSYRVDWVSGACLMIRNEVFRSLGGMNEDYHFNVEEVDLCYRVHQAGWHVCWLPEVSITHLVGQSRTMRSSYSYIHLHRGRILFFSLHYGLLQAVLLKWGFVVTALIKILANTFSSLLSGDDYWKLKRKEKIGLLKWLISEEDVLNQ